MDKVALALWVAISVLLGMIVGAAAGAAKWSVDHQPGMTALVGGGAFGGTVTLALLVINTLRSR